MDWHRVSTRPVRYVQVRRVVMMLMENQSYANVMMIGMVWMKKEESCCMGGPGRMEP